MATIRPSRCRRATRATPLTFSASLASRLRLGSAALLMLMISACQSQDSLVAYIEEMPVDGTLAWLQDRGLTCIDPAFSVAEVQEWRCTAELDGGSAEVSVRGDRSRGVLSVVAEVSAVDDEKRLDEVAIAFFADTVAGIPWEGGEPANVRLWLDQHLHDRDDRVLRIGDVVYVLGWTGGSRSFEIGDVVNAGR